MHENITRSQIFTLAWDRAKAHAAAYLNLRASFAAALKAIWSIYRAVKASDAEQKVRPFTPRPVSKADWFDSNPHRAAAAARASKRGLRWSNGPTSFNW